MYNINKCDVAGTPIIHIFYAIPQYILEIVNLSFQLARDGDVQGIESLFRRISPEPKTGRIIKKINTLDENRVGILHYAARYEHLTMVKLIVHWGGDVNIRGDDGLTPLHFAAK